MKHIKKFESVKPDEEFLEDSYIKEYFMDLIDLGYSYGYGRIGSSSERTKHIQYYITVPVDRLIVDVFFLYFYKELGDSKSHFRSIDEYKNELYELNNCVVQYERSLNNMVFDGLLIESSGVPGAPPIKLQCLQLKFKLKLN